ncbi:MAG: hypothetical protein K2Q06_09705 [Parvularculaceae bacterium]|nr:hypothetical protein [Parvularculaceae bacterium]
MATTTTNFAEIRRWAEKHGGVPAAAKGTQEDGDVGLIRLMFPDSPYSHHDNLVEIGWDAFFDEMEAKELALLYEEDSNFNKIVSRLTAERAHGALRGSRSS